MRSLNLFAATSWLAQKHSTWKQDSTWLRISERSHVPDAVKYLWQTPRRTMQVSNAERLVIINEYQDVK
jgi:hypothetical protein